jgi:hypothetical protein
LFKSLTIFAGLSNNQGMVSRGDVELSVISKNLNKLKNEKKKFLEITDSSTSPRETIPWLFDSPANLQEHPIIKSLVQTGLPTLAFSLLTVAVPYLYECSSNEAIGTKRTDQNTVRNPMTKVMDHD